MNKIWDETTGKFIEMPTRMENFLMDIERVCKKHGLSISHEDYHGKFLVEEYDEDNIKWLFDANKCYVDGEFENEIY